MFDFELPERLIAQYPTPSRDGSRLLVVYRHTQQIIHAHMRDLPQFLAPQDVLVMNNTKVHKARLWAHKKTGGQAEILLVRILENDCFEAMVRTSKVLIVGQTLIVALNCELEVMQVLGQGLYVLKSKHMQVQACLDSYGHMPLPPYMNRTTESLDEQRYQTVYAKVPGSIAAPTAGLHLTHELLDTLRLKGVDIQTLTLHVGLGTFLPVREHAAQDIRQHVMHEESYVIDSLCVDSINNARKKQHLVVAVGTTSLRTLESVYLKYGTLKPDTGHTRLYVTPGFEFKVVDALLTNFHVPKSTLFVLVCSFLGTALAHRVYQEAIRESYRFYSYGDACLLLP